MKSILVAAGSLLAGATLSHGVSIQVSVTAGSNLALAPSYASFSSSSSGIISGGTMASAGLEMLAEDGGTAGLIGERGGLQLFGPTFAGQTNMTVVDVSETQNFFDFAAMVLPSNDFFVATGGVVDPLDITSLLNGSQTSLTLVFNRMYDAGTEVEDFDFVAAGGLAGVTGQTGPNQGADQGANISLVDDTSNPFASFANAGGVDVSALDPSTNGPLASITLTVVPEPSSMLLAALGGLGLLRRRR